MKTKFLLTLCVSLACALTTFAGGADEKAVRDADEAWSKVAGAKDLDKTVSYYADDAIVLPPNEAMVTMKDGTKDHGKYCEVWEKKGGTWKVATDMFSSDLPATPAATPPASGTAEKK